MPAPANDAFASPVYLTGSSGSLTGIDNTLATFETGEPNSARAHSLWYRFELTADVGAWQIDNIGSSPAFDSYLSLFRATTLTPTFSNLAAITSDDDSGGSSLSKMTGTSLPFGVYYVQYASFGSSNSSTGGKLNWTGLTSNGTVTAPSNDNFANATVLGTSSGQITSINNEYAGVESGEPDSTRVHSLWYKFTITGTEASFNIDTVGGSSRSGDTYDPYLVLYKTSNPTSPSFSNLTVVARDDDIASGNVDARITQTLAGSLTAGTYYIRYSTVDVTTATYVITNGVLNWSGLTSISTGGGGTPGAVTAVPGVATADAAAPTAVGLVLANIAAAPGQATADEAPPSVVGLVLANVSAAPGQATADLAAPSVVGLVLANVSGLPGQATADQAAPIVTGLVVAAVSGAPGQATADLPVPSIAAGSRATGSVNAVPADATASSAGPATAGRASSQALAAPAVADVPGSSIAGRASSQAAAGAATADAAGPTIAGGSRVQGAVSAGVGQATADLSAPGVVGRQQLSAVVSATPGSSQADATTGTVSGRAQVASIVAQATADVAAATLVLKAGVAAQPSLAAASIAASVIGGRALVAALAAAAGAELPTPRMRSSRDIALVAVADPRRYTAELDPRRWTST